MNRLHKMQCFGLTMIAALMMPLTAATEVDFSAVSGLEVRAFTESGSYAQDDYTGSVFIEPEWFFELDESVFSLKVFGRYDSADSERTHFDIREAYWQKVGDEWSLTVGINKVFWGVAETQHLVDIINQTDAVENLDGEDKLGQPMINFNWEKDWGTLSLFALPGFRERTFPGPDGRLRFEFPIATDNAQYESAQEQSHIDWAARFSKVMGVWDLGFSAFRGTSREPLLQLDLQTGDLNPYYPQITQFGIDAQATIDSWLWKVEYIYRRGFALPSSDAASDYSAAVAGFEYSFYGVADTAIDVGWILEYQFDERDRLGSAGFSIELSDIVVTGARLTFNDVQSSDLLIGLGFETDNDARFISIEGSRRVGDDLKLALEGRLFNGVKNDPFATLFYSYRNDSFVQVTLEKYF
ncbi:MAG: hypothetical protein HWE11_04270 [Gammaproteobacteria bacterium]|nr:hypothetical protein [Gammaproteobacteria bacterium]